MSTRLAQFFQGTAGAKRQPPPLAASATQVKPLTVNELGPAMPRLPRGLDERVARWSVGGGPDLRMSLLSILEGRICLSLSGPYIDRAAGLRESHIGSVGRLRLKLDD